MKPVERIRAGRVILDTKEQVLETYKSINAAKRASRLWQQTGGSLGDGRLRVRKG
jgi:hypothetical protein